MADFLVDNEAPGTTAPAGGKSLVYIDSVTKKFGILDDGGKHRGILSSNFAAAAQGALATTEVYLTGSNLLIPSWGMEVGQTYYWYISAVKTGASTAAPIWTFRIGAAGAVGDTSRLALTATGVQVATAFDGVLSAMLQVRTVSATGVVAGSGGSGPNFGGGGSGASGSFDNTALAGQYVGLTITSGASAAWTINALHCYMIG